MNIYYSLHELNSLSQMILSLDFKVICLYGDVGSGKTTLTKSVLNRLFTVDIATSPSFGIVNSYEDNHGRAVAYHMDLYRIKSKEELFTIDLEYYFGSDGFIIIEWPEIAEDFLPVPRLNLQFEFITETERKVSLTEILEHR